MYMHMPAYDGADPEMWSKITNHPQPRAESGAVLVEYVGHIRPSRLELANLTRWLPLSSSRFGHPTYECTLTPRRPTDDAIVFASIFAIRNHILSTLKAKL